MNKNKTVLAMVLGLLLALPGFVLASGNIQGKDDWKMETQGWSIEDHMAAAKAEEERVQALQTELQDLEQRIEKIESKPYFDPKGFQRSGLKLLSGKMKGKVELLNERIAWHYRQANHAKLVQ